LATEEATETEASAFRIEWRSGLGVKSSFLVFRGAHMSAPDVLAKLDAAIKKQVGISKEKEEAAMTNQLRGVAQAVVTYRENGVRWTEIGNALFEIGIRPTSGGKWNNDNLRSIFSKIFREQRLRPSGKT
jgi:hypothetical protein